MKKITSFTAHITGEGQRISYTYSEIDDDGNVTSQNNRGNFIVSDTEVQSAIDIINAYVTDKKLS